MKWFGKSRRSLVDLYNNVINVRRNDHVDVHLNLSKIVQGNFIEMIMH